MVVTAETILFQLGLLKNINLYYNSKAYCIEHSNNLSAISESVTEYIQNSLDSRMIVFSGIIVHDCVREEFILLEDGTVRSILYVGVKLSPGLSPWIPSPGLSQWISTLVRSPDQFEVMVFDCISKRKESFKIGETFKLSCIEYAENYQALVAVSYEKLNSVFQLMPEFMSADTEASIIKKNILDYFGIILGCDNVLGCEYLLLLLISRIYSRQLGFVDIQNLGNLKMNISLESTFDVEQVSQFVRLLFAHLQNVIPAVQLLDIHIESLENNTYIPLFGREAEISENYFLQDLLPTSGSLMVSPGTLFLLDETRMNPGKLKENGVNNFQALRTCIDKQILEVPFSDDFSVPVFIDNPIISISLNGKSLSNPNAKGFKVALQEVHNYEEKLASFLKQVPEFYHRARGYFRKSACIIETKFTESLLESIEKNFVARRQIVESDFEKNDAIESDYLTMTAELLHQELILTK